MEKTEEISKLIETISKKLTNQKISVATAESCTGGLLAHYLTSISGSSEYYPQGIISYSNEAKIQLLGVKNQTLEKYGAVSEQTAYEMAQGIRTKAAVKIGISTTGIAGPTGGTQEKPVGLVYIGLVSDNDVVIRQFNFTGTRIENKESTCLEALKILKNILEKN